MTKKQREALDNLNRIGTQMSNLCYNHGQYSRFEPPRVTLEKMQLEQMTALASEWDAALIRVASAFTRVDPK